MNVPLVTSTAPQSALNDIGLHEQITAYDKLNKQHFFPVDKLQAHVDNIPHVAISIFIFNGERLLLQKRASTKYHSAGLWANTVCSHQGGMKRRQTVQIADCLKSSAGMCRSTRSGQ